MRINCRFVIIFGRITRNPNESKNHRSSKFLHFLDKLRKLTCVPFLFTLLRLEQKITKKLVASRILGHLEYIAFVSLLLQRSFNIASQKNSSSREFWTFLSNRKKTCSVELENPSNKTRKISVLSGINFKLRMLKKYSLVGKALAQYSNKPFCSSCLWSH